MYPKISGFIVPRTEVDLGVERRHERFEVGVTGRTTKTLFRLDKGGTRKRTQEGRQVDTVSKGFETD